MDASENLVTLTFLGTGSAITEKGRYPSGIVIDRDILVDAPPQVVSHLKKLDIPPEDLRHILITHFHPDHLIGLIMLAQEWLVMHSRTEPVKLIGPPGLEKTVLTMLEATLGPGYEYAEAFTFFELPAEEGRHYLDGLEIESVPLKHSRFNLGYRIFRDSRIIAVSGDTGFCGNLVKLLDGSTAAAVEMTTIDTPYDVHLNMKEHLMFLARHMKPCGNLFLYHLSVEDEDIFARLRQADFPEAGEILEVLSRENVIIAEDFHTYRV